MKQKIEITKEEVLKALDVCSTRDQLREYFNISRSSVTRLLNKYNLSTFKRVFSELDFKQLYDEGLTDSEIGRRLNVNHNTISNYRRSLNLPSNFAYNRDLLRNQIIKLHESGKTINKIVSELNIDRRIVDYFLNFHEITDFSNYQLSNDEFQVLIGCLLGDGCLSLNRSGNLAQFRFAHSEKQKEYCIWKTEKLKNIMYYEYVFNKKEQYNKRTKNTYTSYYSLSKESPLLKSIFDRWYIYSDKNKRVKWIKHINREDLMKLDALGLAIWFQDDGYHEDSGYMLSTMCFSNEDIELIKEYFKIKWDIEIKVRKNKEIYIPTKYRNKFKKIVEPHIHADCRYKLLNK